jgi:hypothetical protein
MKKLKNQLLVEHSKKNTIFIVQEIQAQNIALKDVFKVIKDNEPILSQRAAWVISTLSDQNNLLLKPFYAELISLINIKFHDAVLRSTFRTLASMQIARNDQGVVFEQGINLLSSKHTAPAIKAWIIEVLMKIAAPHQSLQQEILLVIKAQTHFASIGLKGKILKTIRKINDNFVQDA